METKRLSEVCLNILDTSFLKILKTENKSYLSEVNAANKKHEIWHRDSLSIEI